MGTLARRVSMLVLSGVVALCALPSVAAAAPGARRDSLAKSGRIAPFLGDSLVGALGVEALELEPNNVPSVADPVANGSYSGNVNAESDTDDVYSIYLGEGDEIEVRIMHDFSSGGWGDIDLWLFPPGTPDTFDVAAVDMSVAYLNVEFVRYTVPPGGAGTYYIDVYALETDGETLGYDMDVSVNDAAVISGVERYAGDDRYMTAIETSYQTFTDNSCNTAVIATGRDFPDALSASGLAGAFGGPLLLTPPTELYADIPSELSRLGVTDVIIVGGTGAVSAGVANELDNEGFNVDRIAGATRYETAALVADEVIAEYGAGFIGEAFVVRGDSFPDALAAAPFAYRNGIPILLTPSSYLHAETESVIEAYDITSVFIAGGTAAVSNATEAEIEALKGGSVSAERFAGLNRYETAAVLADGMVNDLGYNSFALSGVATGESFPDALAGGAAMGYEGGVLLLTLGDHLNIDADDVMWNNMFAGDDAVVFGGDAVIETEGTLLDVWLLLEGL